MRNEKARSRLAGRVALLVMLAGMAPVAFGRCGPSWFSEHGVRKPVTVTLAGPQRNEGDAPVFYLRSERKEWFLLTVRPEDLVRTLEDYGAKPDGRATGDNGGTLRYFYEQVTRDLPLKEDTDLFKYVLRDNRLDAWFDRLTPDLMTKGLVGIDLAPYQDHNPGTNNEVLDPTTLTIVSVFDGDQERSRYFCTPDGKLLLEHWYLIY
jgi:hypothetical protein